MYLTFFVGTAGSGKSLLTGAFNEWLVSKKQDSITVNLDPGATSLPYRPDIDIRESVVLSEIMEKYELGPNGALLMAADLMASKIDDVREELERQNPSYALIDTPGQLELFAFRASGPYIASEISKEPKAVVYLFDASFSSDPANYASNVFLATAVYLKLLLPQTYVLTKVDLLPKEVVDEILTWSEDQDALLSALDAKLEHERRLISKDLIQSIDSLELAFELTPVSAKTNDGFIDLHAQLTRIFQGGDEIV